MIIKNGDSTATIECPRCEGAGEFANGRCFMCYGEGRLTAKGCLRRIKYNREQYSEVTGRDMNHLIALARFAIDSGIHPDEEHRETYEWCVAVAPPEKKKFNAKDAVVDCARRIAADATTNIRDQRTVDVATLLIVELRGSLNALETEEAPS